eukprot:359660-Chlamydomonas_euryale.AAC.15
MAKQITIDMNYRENLSQKTTYQIAIAVHKVDDLHDASAVIHLQLQRGVAVHAIHNSPNNKKLCGQDGTRHGCDFWTQITACLQTMTSSTLLCNCP